MACRTLTEQTYTRAMGKTIVLIGAALIVCGLLVMLFERFSLRAGPLPGDIVVRRGNWTVYFPVVTSIVVSVVLTLILMAASYLSRK